MSFSRNQTVFGLGLLAAVIVANGYISYINTRRLLEAAGWVAHTHQVSDTLSQIIGSLNEAESNQRGYLITGSPAYLPRYNEAVQALDRQLATLTQLTRDNPAQQQNIDEMQKLVVSRHAELDRNIKLRQEEGIPRGARVDYRWQGHSSHGRLAQPHRRHAAGRR